METVFAENFRGVFAVPPLARTEDARSIDFSQNEAIIKHIKRGGISRVIYGGNAFLYHLQMRDFEAIVEWLDGISVEDLWAIPSIGPSYGRALEQSKILRAYNFPCTMILPCSDPRDAVGLERGYREIAEAAQTQLVVYLKDETNFGQDKEAGLDAVARLIDDKVCVGIKYAVVQADPARILIWSRC